LDKELQFEFLRLRLRVFLILILNLSHVEFKEFTIINIRIEEPSLKYDSIKVPRILKITENFKIIENL